MPRVTRRSLAAAEEKEEKTESQPQSSRSRGRRGAKNVEPVESASVDEPQESPAKAGRRSGRAKETTPKEAPRGRASSRSVTRGKGKGEPEPPEEDVEEEAEEKEEKATSKRGSRGRSRGRERGKPAAGRSSRGKAAEEEEEEEEMEEEADSSKTVEPSKPPSGSRGRGRSKAAAQEEDKAMEEADSSKSVEPPKPPSGSRGRGRSKAAAQEEEDKEMEEEADSSKSVEPPKPPSGSRGRGRSKAVVEEEEDKEIEEEADSSKSVEPPKPPSGSRGRGRSKVAAEEEAQEEVKEEVKTTPRGRQRKTPTKTPESEPTPPSGGRRQSGRRAQAAEEVTPKKTPTPERSSRRKTESPPEASKNKDKADVEAESTGKDQKNAGKEEKEEKTEEAMETEEPQVETGKSAETAPQEEEKVPEETAVGQKRKHEEEDVSDGEVKRARLSATIPAPSATAEVPKEDAKEELSDFVIVNKEDVPAADSKEVVDALPPVKKVEETEEKEMVQEDSKIEEPLNTESTEMEVTQSEESPSEEDKAEEEEEVVQAEPETKEEAQAMDVQEEKQPEEKQPEVPAFDLNKPPEEAPTSDSNEVPTETPTFDSKETPIETPTSDSNEAPTEAPASDSNEAPTEAPAPDLKEALVQKTFDEAPSQTPAKETSTPDLPVVVPLTEAELAKQYNPTVRDRDETSSTLVEVGSEAASDVMSTTRNLDVSDAVSMDATTSEQINEESNLSSDSHAHSEKSADPATTPKVVADETSKNSLCNIPLPPQSSEAAPALVNNSTTPQQLVSEVSLNSIPLPPSSAVANTESQSSTPSSAPAAISTPITNATQNGNVQSSDPVQSVPLHTSTPAKRPSFASLEGYVPSSTSIDKRKFIINPNFPVELFDTAFCFSVVSYNILADVHMRRTDYSYTEPKYLDQSYRHNLLTQELEYLDGDIVCMQEVNPAYYNDTLLPLMKSKGFQGMFIKRTKEWYDEGEATFVKTSKFEILSHQGLSLRDLAYKEIDSGGLSEEVTRAAKKYLDRADVILLCKLLSKKTGKTLTLCNIHVVWDMPSPDVQCIQVACAIKELVSTAGNDLNPYIICGDFNSEVTGPAYHLAKEGYLSDAHIRSLQALEKMDNTDGSSRSLINHLWRAFQHTSSNLKSAYETAVGKEPRLTSFTKATHAALDYIFFSASSLYTVGALEVIDQQVIEANGGLPSKTIPSDHVSMKALFRLKD